MLFQDVYLPSEVCEVLLKTGQEEDKKMKLSMGKLVKLFSSHPHAHHLNALSLVLPSDTASLADLSPLFQHRLKRLELLCPERLNRSLLSLLHKNNENLVSLTFHNTDSEGTLIKSIKSFYFSVQLI